MNGGWGVGGGGVLTSFMVTQWGVTKYMFVAAILLKSRFSIPVKSLCCVSVQCIVVVMWNSAQCYSVVCGEDMLLFTFTIFISRDYCYRKQGH